MADQDGDGFLTWEEYWSGTDPMDSDSYLRVESISLGGTNIVLQWQHAEVDAGLPAISIMACTNLVSGVWVEIGQKTPVNGANQWGASQAGQVYYRLAVINAP